ncbi:UNVERIFIED_CONTAM: hypothetical protein Sradi_2375300 [Sesamum radiatum]|uniref:DDE Tnp4 domain-containing protein n=1 Tax=Sesamum radiatum TaxID=300843 RepID=A0AAW2T7G1_SESRA
MNRAQRVKIFVALQFVVVELVFALYLSLALPPSRGTRRSRCNTPGTRQYKMYHRISDQVKHLSQIIDISDVKCINNLRMSRNAFGRLCQLLYTAGGLLGTIHVSVTEQVAIFLAVLRLSSILLTRSIPVGDDCEDSRWGYFKGCLGALDGTHIDVRVPDSDKGCYRNRKGHVSTNVLGVCNIGSKFIYVLKGWEGSAADGRVLRDAVHRTAGIKVPTGNYYLCDNGYGNVEGFLTPYRGVRYHLKE